jgi:isoleucyl-tRNA synthetase
LPALLIVSQVELGTDPGPGAYQSSISGLKIGVRRAAGAKCERCWNYSEQVGRNSAYVTVCERCSAALEEIEHSQTSGA